MINDRITITKQDNVIIFGRIIDKNNRLGNFEVYSDMYGAEPKTYATYIDAEKRADAIRYAMAKNQPQKPQTNGTRIKHGRSRMA